MSRSVDFYVSGKLRMSPYGENSLFVEISETVDTSLYGGIVGSWYTENTILRV